MHPSAYPRFVVTTMFSLVTALACVGPEARDDRSPADDRLSVAEQKQDLELLWRALSHAHVGLDRYEPKAAIERRFDALLAGIEAPASRLSFFAQVAAFNASINSGHLYTIATGELGQEVLGLPRLPLDLRMIRGRLYVWRDVADETSIATGSEVLAINGEPTAEILARILPNVPTDGFIETSKPHLIHQGRSPTYRGFDLYYALYGARPAAFAVRYLDVETELVVEASLSGLIYEQKRDRLKERYPEPSPQDLRSPRVQPFESRNAALLSLRRSFHREEDPDLDETMRELLDAMERQSIEHLVIDIRGNGGGNDDHPSQVFRYLTDRPLRYYRGLLRKTIQLSAFEPFLPPDERRPQLEPEWYEQDDRGRFWERLEDGYHLLHSLDHHPDPFLGAVYLLVDGGSFSSGSQFAALFHDRRRALLIGEETGGDYAGPDGGQALVIGLPASEIQVRIPLIRSLNTFQPWPAGRGVLPHCRISPSVDELLKERDVHLELAFELIERGIDLETFDRVELPGALPAACLPAPARDRP